MIKKIILIIINLLVYCLLDIKSLPLLIALTILSFLLCKWMEIAENSRRVLYVSIAVVVMTWFICRDILGHMPLGISYYSFKIISYMVDRYTGKSKLKVGLIEYFAYVSFFPQIISGPISRSDEVIGQLDRMTLKNIDNWIKGIKSIIVGLFLKYVIAERLVLYVDTVFGDYANCTGLALWLAAFFYSVEIYCDFAGYSNISIGISNVFGIKCSDNFNKPYLSTNIKEFWGRWHISLSSWLRDYIYIPLGGNRKGKLRKNINLVVTFLISGIWHGNGSGYIFWGLYHGILNMFPMIKNPNKCIERMLMICMNFAAVTIGWIFFKLENVNEGIEYIKCMFINFRFDISEITSAVLPFTNDNSCVAFLLTAVAFIFIQLLIEVRSRDSNPNGLMAYMFYTCSIVLFGSFGSNGFIYMNY